MFNKSNRSLIFHCILIFGNFIDVSFAGIGIIGAATGGAHSVLNQRSGGPRPRDEGREETIVYAMISLAVVAGVLAICICIGQSCAHRSSSKPKNQQQLRKETPVYHRGNSREDYIKCDLGRAESYVISPFLLRVIQVLEGYIYDLRGHDGSKL